MVTAAVRQKLYRHTLVSAAALAAAAAAAMASAATPAQVRYSSDRVPSVEVRYDDLNLSTDEGTRALYQRIKSAAQQVCPVAHSGDLSALATSQRCQSDAIAQAVQAVNKPALASIHAAHTRHG
jgi:UrcA family protein